jgi:hypothetical protein
MTSSKGPQRIQAVFLSVPSSECTLASEKLKKALLIMSCYPDRLISEMITDIHSHSWKFEIQKNLNWVD